MIPFFQLRRGGSGSDKHEEKGRFRESRFVKLV
jgi:hypothetical protein